MRNRFKAALAITALALGPSAALAPAASAAVHTATVATPAMTGTETGLVPAVGSYAWVHFLPTVTSDHLNVYRTDTLTTVCKVTSGGNVWNLVVDKEESVTGYTLADYLVYKSSVPCTAIGNASGVPTQTWVHLHTDETWEHQVVNPGDALRSACSVYALYNGSLEWWDVVVDNTTGMAGFTLDQYVTGARPSECF